MDTTKVRARVRMDGRLFGFLGCCRLRRPESPRADGGGRERREGLLGCGADAQAGAARTRKGGGEEEEEEEEEEEGARRDRASMPGCMIAWQ